MENGTYVELFYFTNEGIADAEEVATAPSDESFVWKQQDNGTPSLVEASTAKRGLKTDVLPDEKLSWEQFFEATPHMIQFMKRYHWPQDRIDMFCSFFLGIQSHRWRTSSHPLCKKSLLFYQAKQRCLWHHTIGSDFGFTLAEIEEEVLRNIRDELMQTSFSTEFNKMQSVSFRVFPPPLSGTHWPAHNELRPGPVTLLDHVFTTRHRLTMPSYWPRRHATPPLLTLPTPSNDRHPSPPPQIRQTLRARDIAFAPPPLQRTTPPTPPPRPMWPTHLSSLSALFASAGTATQLPSALLPSPGTNNSRPYAHETTVPSSPVPTSRQFVPNGSERPVVKTNIPISTCVQVVPPPLMALVSALERRKQLPLTPYNARTWELELSSAGLLPRFSKILPGLSQGFVINFPPILRTQSPPNNSSVLSYAAEFNTIICKELAKGRYLGPFPLPLIEQVLGPYQSSPLSIIPKIGRPGKFRVIQNFSFPLIPSIEFPSPSINSDIAAEDFPTTWGKFSLIYDLISRLPPGSEAATRDVAEAYRTIPIHPSQWPAGVMKLSDTMGCIDTNLAFGSTPAAGVYGHISDACCEIFRFHGIGPVDKWVDDHIFFRVRTRYLNSYNKDRRSQYLDIQNHPPHPLHSGGRLWFQGRRRSDSSFDEFNEDCRHPLKDLSALSPRPNHDALFSYSLHDIDTLSRSLGIPWELSKDQPFGSSTIYIGFEWNLQLSTVSLSAPKVTKYLGAIADWRQRSRHVLQDVQSLHGKLLHTCAVIPRGRAYLTGLERMISLCTPKPFLPHRPEKTIAEDLIWWHHALSSNLTTQRIRAPPNYADISAFSDASSSFGIGVVIGDRWRAWRLHPNWQSLGGKRDISWAEAVGFELLIYTIATIKFPHPAFIAFGDNMGIVEGWYNSRHRNPPANEAFRRIHHFIHSLPREFDIHTKYIPSEANPADGPSRGILGHPSKLLPDIPIPISIRYLLEDAAPG